MALAQPDYYTLKAHGRSIGQVRIDHYPASHLASSDSPSASANRYSHTVGLIDGHPDDMVTEILNTNHFTREGMPFGLNEVSRFVERGPNRQPLSFSYQYALGEQRLLAAQGQLQGNALDLQFQRENSIAQGTAPIAGERFLFPDGEAMHQVYRQHFSDPAGSRFEFQTLALGMQPQIVNTEVVSGKRERLKLGRGHRPVVRRFEVKNPANPTSSIHEWRDAQGKLYKAKSSGSDELEMVLAAVGDEQHWAKLDVINTSAVLSNRIAQPRITTEGLYRLSPIHGQSIIWTKTVPQGDRQTYDRPSNQQLYLKVIQREPQDSSITFPIDGPPEYLRSTPYLQSTDPEIDALALDIAGKEQRAYYAAKRLQQWVYQHIEQKDLSLGFASAKETLARRQGDCTEHAVLLTALSRALGIPARVAVGLIYLPNGDSQLGRFVYHMWTEIYLGDRFQGEWIPLDATTAKPLADATHIKLADSTLNSVNDVIGLTQRVTDVMGRMKIDVLKAMSLSQSVLNMDPQAKITATAQRQVDLDRIDIQALSRQAIQRFKVELPPPEMSKDRPEGLFTYGVTALSKGQYTTAEGYFQQALAQTRQPVAQYRLGEQLAGLELYDFAREAFETAARQDPRLKPLTEDWETSYLPAKPLPAKLNSAYLEALNNLNSATAMLQLQMITSQAPDFAPALRHLGEMQQGNEAIQTLKQAVAIAPNDFRNLDSLGDKLLGQGKYSAAIQAYQRAIITLKNNLAFRQSKPEWIESLTGKLTLAQGTQALSQNEHSLSGWLNISKGLLQQKRRSEASRALDNAIRLAPDNLQVEELRFRMALQTGDWQTLLAQKDRMANLASQHTDAALLIGLYQMRSRQYQPAIHSLRQAIAASPGEGESYRALSQTYLRLAELALQKPGTAASRLSQQYNREARATLRQGIIQARHSLTRQSLALQLARLLLKSGQTPEAQKLTDDVLSQNPIHGEAWTILGKTQFYQGDNITARKSLETALTLNPNDPDTLVLLGHVCKEEGRDTTALDFYQKAFKADPFHQEAADSVRSLMAELKIAGHQPPAYWFLTDDEHDYLVQLLYQGKTLKQHTLKYLQTLNALPGRAGKITFSSQGIQATTALHDTLKSMQSQESALFHQLDQAVVPQRFKSVHAELQSAVLSQINMLALATQEGPVLSHSAGESSREAYQQLLLTPQNAQAPLDHLVNQLQANMPVPIYNSLLAEAQLGDLGTLNQEIASLTQILSNKKDSVSENQKPITKSAGMAPPPHGLFRKIPRTGLMPPPEKPPGKGKQAH